MARERDPVGESFAPGPDQTEREQRQAFRDQRERNDVRARQGFAVGALGRFLRII